MPIAKYSYPAIDCPNPLALAEFYSKLSGLAMEPLEDFDPEKVTWFSLLRDGEPVISFQRIPNFVAPTWPEGPVPQQMHLDFDVKDLDVAEVKVLALGATKAEFQSATNFRVYLDPVGHPFCLVLNANVELFGFA
jgi:hypothetical protein